MRVLAGAIVISASLCAAVEITDLVAFRLARFIVPLLFLAIVVSGIGYRWLAVGGMLGRLTVACSMGAMVLTLTSRAFAMAEFYPAPRGADLRIASYWLGGLLWFLPTVLATCGGVSVVSWERTGKANLMRISSVAWACALGAEILWILLVLGAMA